MGVRFCRHLDGLTDLVQFKIETGLHPPICQGPYNTPQALLSSVNKELDWLKAKGYIRESSSNWSSPMVTVRKLDGSARLCIDFKAINAITTSLLFYMPRVEEVLSQSNIEGRPYKRLLPSTHALR